MLNHLSQATSSFRTGIISAILGNRPKRSARQRRKQHKNEHAANLYNEFTALGSPHNCPVWKGLANGENKKGVAHQWINPSFAQDSYGAQVIDYVVLIAFL